LGSSAARLRDPYRERYPDMPAISIKPNRRNARTSLWDPTGLDHGIASEEPLPAQSDAPPQHLLQALPSHDL